MSYDSSHICVCGIRCHAYNCPEAQKCEFCPTRVDLPGYTWHQNGCPLSYKNQTERQLRVIVLEWTFEHVHSSTSTRPFEQPRSYLQDQYDFCTNVHANIMRVLQNALCRQPTHIAPRQSPVVYKHKFSQHKPQNGSRRIHQPTLR